MPKTRPPANAEPLPAHQAGATIRLPRPFDAAGAAMLAGRFAERGTPERNFAASEQGAALVAALGGHSPYLADLALRESATLLRLMERGPDATFALALDPLGVQLLRNQH